MSLFDFNDDYPQKERRTEEIVSGEPIERPETIMEYFNCFGKGNHDKRKNNYSITIDIFDLSLWVDNDVLSGGYFGRNAEEIKVLYDVFLLKKRYNRGGKEIVVKTEDDRVSGEWSMLLSNLSSDDLLDVLKCCPKLQPALPKVFCKSHLSLLSENYGMPNEEICELYCINQISKAKTISDYKRIIGKLDSLLHMEKTHHEGVGFLLCELPKTCINRMKNRLRRQYNSVIKKNVLVQYSSVCESLDINKLLNNKFTFFYTVGEYMDLFCTIKDEPFDYYKFYKLFDLFEKIPQPHKNVLAPSLRKCVNESMILKARDGYTEPEKRTDPNAERGMWSSRNDNPYTPPSLLHYDIDWLKSKGWITQATIQQVKELVNGKFAAFENYIWLENAYCYRYITRCQYFYGYKNMTKDYSAQRFLEVMYDSGIEYVIMPLYFKWYIVSRIISLLGYDKLDEEELNRYGYARCKSIEYSDYDYHPAHVFDIRSLFAWLQQERGKKRGIINDVIYKKAEKQICARLSDEDNWKLFEENIIQSPGESMIKQHLQSIYGSSLESERSKFSIPPTKLDENMDPELYNLLADIMKSQDNSPKLNDDLFHYSYNEKVFWNSSKVLDRKCVQDVMLADAKSTEDMNILRFIADNLDAEHLELMRQDSTGFMELYIWQISPTDTCDWELVKTYFSQMPIYVQVNIIKCIFRMMASNSTSITLDDLYTEFVQNSSAACSVVRGVLYMLKEKSANINSCLTSSMVESVVGIDLAEREAFLADLRHFMFFPCEGRNTMLVGQWWDCNDDSEIGVMKTELKGNELYYVITLYEFEENNKRVEAAEQVLIRYAFVEKVDERYYIKSSHKLFALRFAIEYRICVECEHYEYENIEGKTETVMRLLGRNYEYHRNFNRCNYVCGCHSTDDCTPYSARIGDRIIDIGNIPFCWCRKKPCVRNAHFLCSINNWRQFHFVDLLFIVLGQDWGLVDEVWRVHDEISKFINAYAYVYDKDERFVASETLNTDGEIGVLQDDISFIYVRPIYEDYEDRNDYNDCYDQDYEDPTYDRYNGSYAQDEMGYSDDEIDEIFDGDPLAYWNID